MIYDPASYGDNWADVYERHVADRAWLDPTAAVEFLLTLAPDGRALELGIGAGRIALPLADAGLNVHGIDASSKMLDLLRAKVESRSLKGSVSWNKEDITNFESSVSYTLIYAIYDAVLLLPSQEDQINCFRCAAKALEFGGRLVIESNLPNTGAFTDNNRLEIVRTGESGVEFRIQEHRPIEQQFVGSYVWLTQDGIRIKPLLMRYARPPELDLMARLAGLRLESRYASWDKSVFELSSTKHVSVYVKHYPN